MKILVLSNKPPYPTVDGGTFATFQLVKDLADASNEVFVLAMVTSKHPSSIDEIPESIKKKITFQFVPINSDVTISGIIRNFLRSDLPYTAERFISKDFSSALVGVLAEHTFDLIQLEGLYLTPYIPLLKKESKIPVVLRAHNIEHEIWKRLSSNHKNPIKRFYFKNLTKRISNFEYDVIDTYDLLVPITKVDEKKFNSMGNSKPSVVIPVGVNNETVVTKSNEGQKTTLFYLGALDWQPNTEGLLWFIKKVWPQIKADYPNLEFHIAGRNAPPGFQKLVADDRIIFHGEIPSAKDFILKNTIMVVPLFSGSGMRVKIIEAMSYGKAIVTTRVGAEGIDVINGEHILISDNAVGIITSIKQLIENDNFLSKIESNARNLVQQSYMGDKLAEELTEEYHKLIK